MLETIQKAQNGNQASFAQIYDAFAEALFRYIRIKVQNKQQAEDLLQETFIKAWRGLPKLQADENLKFKAWLYTIATNVVNDHCRKLYSRPESLELNENLEVSSGRSPAQETLIASDVDTLKQALQQLPKQYQEILELRFVSDLTLEECGKILKKRAVNIRVLQYRALQHLKKVLNKNAF